MKHVFSGTLVHSTAESRMDISQKRIIGVDDDGKVTDFFHLGVSIKHEVQPAKAGSHISSYFAGTKYSSGQATRIR